MAILKENRKPRPRLTPADAIGALKMMHGAKAEEMLSKVRTFIQDNAPQPLRDYLNKTGLGNSIEIFSRVHSLMLDTEREEAERQGDVKVASSMFNNSPEMDRARRASQRGEYGDRITHAITQGKCDFINLYGAIGDVELEAEQHQYAAEAQGEGEGGDQ